jgi:hypothetical protein
MPARRVQLPAGFRFSAVSLAVKLKALCLRRAGKLRLLATSVSHPEGRGACLSAAGTRHQLLLKAPANASRYSFAVTRIVVSSLRLSGELQLLQCNPP